MTCENETMDRAEEAVNAAALHAVSRLRRTPRSHVTRSPGRMLLAASMVSMVLLTGCASTRPWVNGPFADNQVTPDPDSVSSEQAVAQGLQGQLSQDFSTMVVVTLSGGGARAAAFGYGVLQTMHQTPMSPVHVPAQASVPSPSVPAPTARSGGDSLLDRVSFISGVSGGSIVAAYYAAFGAETFERFEPEFLRRNFQDSLISLAFKPASLVDLTSPWFGRSQLLARRLDELYQGRTFGDMWARPGRPRLLISATDLSLGSSFDFSWSQFSAICSDLSRVPLSFAVAASSAVPIVLSPVTVRNYAGSCQSPASDELAPAQGRVDYRMRMRRSQRNSYQDVASRPYIHLVDGGVADNLGLRSLLDRSAEGGIRQATRDLPKGSVHRLVMVAVNAERDPSERIDESDTVPTTAQVVDAMLFGTGARATQETLGLLNDMTGQWKRELLTASDTQSAFADGAKIHVINVNLRDAPEAMERARLLQIPTAFSIPADDVTRLIEAGGNILRASPGFKELVQSLQ